MSVILFALICNFLVWVCDRIFFELNLSYTTENEEKIMNLTSRKTPTTIIHRLNMLKITNIQDIMVQLLLIKP